MVNSAGTSVEFFIDGVSQGTTTTNIPTSTNDVEVCAVVLKSAGTSARGVVLDYIKMTTARS